MKINNVSKQNFGYNLSSRYAASLILEKGVDKGIAEINRLRNTGNSNFELRCCNDIFLYSIPKYGLEKKSPKRLNPEKVEQSFIKTLLKDFSSKRMKTKLIKDFPHLKETIEEYCKLKDKKYILF